MNVLALDLGTRTGWALSEGGRIESGVQDFTPKRGESLGMRYLHFRRWLEMAANGLSPRGVFVESTPRVGLIVYEMPHLRGGHAATVLAGLQTRIEEYQAAHPHVELAPVHSATLKKFTTGSGRGDKRQMWQAAFDKHWLKDETDDNEVDAICLLYYALAELVGPAPSTVGRAESVESGRSPQGAADRRGGDGGGGG